LPPKKKARRKSIDINCESPAPQIKLDPPPLERAKTRIIPPVKKINSNCGPNIGSFETTSPTNNSSKYSMSNPSLHLTSSSSGMGNSKDSGEESTGRKKFYGQVAKQTTSKQVIVVPARILSPKAVSWNRVNGFFGNDSEAMKSRKCVIELKNPKNQIKEGMQKGSDNKKCIKKFLEKPALFIPSSKIQRIMHKKVNSIDEQAVEYAIKRTVTNVFAAKSDTFLDNNTVKREAGFERTEDIQPLTTRICWSNEGRANIKKINPPL